MKVKVPIIFKELDLTDRQLIFAELLYNLHKSYTGKWWFSMHQKDVKILFREEHTKYRLTTNFLNKLFKGLVEFVDLGDERWLVRITEKGPNKLYCFEHKLTEPSAIKMYCYMLGRLSAGIIEGEFEPDMKTKTVYVSGARGEGVINAFQIEQLNA